MALFYFGNTNASIRNLTSPQIVMITCLYLRGFNRNLSEATRNIFTKRIKCSTKIRYDARSLFFSFCSRLNSCFFGFFVGVLIDGSPS
ncbi:hypothetical protein NIES4073_38340 [Kalymmatonema gypsitolerans NIES-4073]|nr:hypothetical protein NIES4073_38340 [Scytonema sp. NIES-4073]